MVVLVAMGVVVAISVYRRGRGWAWPAEGGDTRAEGETLEHLVEDDDGKEGEEEAVTRDDEGETDHWSEKKRFMSVMMRRVKMMRERRN